jgi:hypothetical protein
MVVKVPGDAGKIERWGEGLVLREPTESLIVDLTELEYPGPFFLARLRGLIDWHSSMGQNVRVISPRRQAVRSYLEHMHLAEDLPATCACDLETLEPEARSKVLIPIRRLCSRVAIVGARSSFLRTAVAASVRHATAAAWVGNVLRIFLPSRLL